MMHYPPGPTPSRQELLKFAQNPLTYLTTLAHQYGEFSYVKLGNRDTYVVTAPDILREILVEKADKFQKPGHTRDSASRFLGEGLLVSSGAVHQRHRRIMQPLFTRSALEPHAGSMLQAVQAMTVHWERCTEIDAAGEMMNLALNIVGSIMFGVSTLAHDQSLRTATSVMQQYSGNTLVRSKLTALTEADIQSAVDTLDGLVRGILERPHDTPGLNLVTLLQTAVDPVTGDRLSVGEVRDEALNILMAGHETTAIALTWALYLLAKHPDVQEQVTAEVGQVLGNRPITSADVPTLTGLGQVIQETLRLYPPAWLLGRTSLEPVTIAGYPVLPEANLVISPYVIHRNAKRFPDPEQFRPARFAQEPERFAYVPFGVGPHVCLGQPFAQLEMVITLATLLQHFHFSLPEGVEAVPEALMTLRPQGGMRLHVERIGTSVE